MDGIYTVPDALAALTVPGFEFERGDAPDTVHLVGALPGRSAAGWRPRPGGRNWTAAPVVVVTQGTFANRDLSSSSSPP